MADLKILLRQLGATSVTQLVLCCVVPSSPHHQPGETCIISAGTCKNKWLALIILQDLKVLHGKAEAFFTRFFF